MILLLTNTVTKITAKSQPANGVIPVKRKNSLKGEHSFPAGTWEDALQGTSWSHGRCSHSRTVPQSQVTQPRKGDLSPCQHCLSSQPGGNTTGGPRAGSAEQRHCLHALAGRGNTPGMGVPRTAPAAPAEEVLCHQQLSQAPNHSSWAELLLQPVLAARDSPVLIAGEQRHHSSVLS